MKKCLRKFCPGSISEEPNPIPQQVPVEDKEGPYAGVDSSLRALAGAAEGFGSSAVGGGLDAKIYHVTTLADDGHGSFRNGCRQSKPLWIVFDISGTIQLSTGVRVASHKTIDGRGQRIKLRGHGLQLKSCEHVIICNLEFEEGRGHDVDGIQIKPNTNHVWIDRCTLSDYDDGLIDITRSSSNITISRCHFHHHDKTMLISADAKHIEDRGMKITIHHCFYDGTKQRHPRVRFAKVHLYNNFSRDWGIYAVCASVESQILSQCNVYEAGAKKKTFEYYAEKALDSDVEVHGSLRSEGDVFLNGAKADVRGAGEVFRAEEFYQRPSSIEPAGKKLVEKLCRITGWQDVPLPADKA